VDKTSTAQLAAPPPPQIATASGTGSALFVINLCASIAPVRLDGNNIPGLENYRLYQVARNEDGRTRHRLRLGFFTSESHAESVLTVVRQQYPTAFTACLCEEDRRFARGFLPETAAAQPKPAAVQMKPAAAATHAKPAAPAAATKPAAPAAPANKAPAVVAKAPAAAADEVVELTWEPEKPAPAPVTAAAPKHAAKAAGPGAASQSAVGSTECLDEFTWEPPSLTPAADAAIAKSAATGVMKAKLADDKRTTEKATSDTAKHPALKLAAKPPVPAPAKAAAPVVAKPAAPVVAKPAAPVAAKPAAPALAKPAAPVVAKPATPIAAKPAIKPTAAPAIKPAAAPAPAPSSKPDTASSMRVRAIDLSFSDPPPAPARAQPAGPAAPFHVGKGVEIKETGIHLEAEPAAPAKPTTEKASVATKPAATPAPKAPAKVADKAAKPAPTPAAPVAAAKPAAVSAPAAIRITSSAPPPELDSTQTIRALTNAEMEDEQQDKWFAVQLAVSDQPVNLDAMPHLDIFEAYRLYSVATAGSGKIMHSLRLGFFKEAVSAEAVSGYLKTFFGSPTIMRVSVAEQARFKDPPSSRKPAASAHEAKIVELNNARTTARPVIPTVTMEVATGVDTSVTGAFKPLDTGAFKTSATGTHKALKSVAKSAGSNTKRARAQSARTGNTGKHKTVPSFEKKTLAEELLDEAREVELSESGIRKLPKNDSLLSRMFGKRSK
jgi:hypothetical protein